METMLKTVFMTALAGLCACTIPDKICEVDREDNTCNSDSDCVIAYCAADCTICPAVYSRKQVDEAWCLTPIDESPRDRCVEAAESVCSVSSLPAVCPRRFDDPICEDGMCKLNFEE